MMFGGVLDLGVGVVLGWLLHRYGWTNLVAWVKAKFASVVQEAAKKLQETPAA